MPTGKVKWFDVAKGYGFILPDDGGSDVFLHLSKVQESNLPTLETGTLLQYSLGFKSGKGFAEGLSLIGPTRDRGIPSQTPHKSIQEKSDLGDAFEMEWGLRRS